ncbi:MAG: hypothetical protein ACRELC_09570 [Gemmatimonadota bacterium]
MSTGHWLLVVLLLATHFALHPVLARWPFGPDLLAGGLLLASLRLRASYAASLGFVLGLLEGAMALTAPGPVMIVLTLAGYLGARLRDLFYSDTARFVPTFIFVGVWALEAVLATVVAWPPDAGFLLLAAPVAAAATALVCWIGEQVLGFFIR